MRRAASRFIAALTILLAACGSLPTRADAAIELLGVGEIPGTDSDGLVLDPTTLVNPATGEEFPHDRVGGLGSAIAYTGIGNRYVMTPDRGPADGTVPYLDRYYLVDIAVTPGGSPAVAVSVTHATLLTNQGETPFTGLASAFDATGSPASRRLDPEGTRVSPRGTFFVSDEYGPYLYEFDAAGRRLRSLAVPAAFLIAHPSEVISATFSCELPHIASMTCPTTATPRAGRATAAWRGWRSRRTARSSTGSCRAR